MFILLSATLENSYLYEIVSQHLSRSYWVSQWVKYWPSAQVLPLESGIKPSIRLPVQGECFSLCPSPKSCLLCRIRKICLKKCFLRGCPPLGIPCVPSRSPLEPRVTVPNIFCGADCLSHELRMQTYVCHFSVSCINSDCKVPFLQGTERYSLKTLDSPCMSDFKGP